MRRADRLFQLVQLLQARRVTTARVLAEELGVSLRTVYRDVADLVGHGVPIEGEAGVGYRLARGFSLPPMTFTPEELEALALGARMVEAWGDRDLGLAARALLTKVDAVLPEGLRPLVADTALFALGTGVAAARRQSLAPLREAIRRRRKIELTYRDGQGAETARVVWPLALHFWGKAWTLAAWCELRADYRSFRPDRITAVAILDAPRPDGPASLEGFLAAFGDDHG